MIFERLSYTCNFIKKECSERDPTVLVCRMHYIGYNISSFVQLLREVCVSILEEQEREDA